MINEQEIIDGCKAGKEKYQKLLYQLFSDMLMGICLRYAKNEMEAEDILHDSLLRFTQKSGHIVGKVLFESLG